MAVILATTLGACSANQTPMRTLAGADPDRGLVSLIGAGCPACHQIPGVDWPRARTGASLAGFARRPMIAGKFPNQPAVLTRWLRDAPSMSPQTAMPPSGLSEAEARDVAAYLYTLDD